MVQVRRLAECAKGSCRALLLSLGLVLTIGLAHATEDQAAHVHPLQDNHRNWPIINVSINGQETPALLDTGATIALIDDAYLAAETLSDEANETSVLGIGGQQLFPVVRLNTLSAGPRSWYNLRAAVNTRDVFPVQQNILPTSIFTSSIVDFDFPNSRVEFYSGKPKYVRAEERSRIRYRAHQGLIVVPVRINGIRGKAIIDTGASVSFVNPRFLHRAGGRPMFEPRKDLQGSDLERNPVEIYRFRELRFGNHEVSRFTVAVFDTDLFETLGFEDGPMMVMGMDLLRHFRLQLDQERQRIVFSH